ncbi:MAG: TRAP transporter permease [Acidobacteriota bacterium]
MGISALSIGLAGLVLVEVNHPTLTPQTQLALFALLGLTLCFLTVPARRGDPSRWTRRLDGVLVTLAVGCCGFVAVQNEPVFSRLWIGSTSLGNRAGMETGADIAVGIVGLVLVLEAARRTLGLALPVLAGAFLLYAASGPLLPGWLLPHRGYSVERIVSQAFLHSQGVFSVALRVMFTYVFLFVLLGVFLSRTGATSYIIDVARRVFARSPGGPAKVAVLSSGLMGSLSGSAVANTATTGTFTIPMMRSAGFSAQTAAGIEAAASSGGALVPPVMGAGAYMMLEIIDPPVTFLQIIKAAILPAALYYLSLLLIVHFTSRRFGAAAGPRQAGAVPAGAVRRFEGVVFAAAFAGLLLFLLLGYSAFRAVSLSLAVAYGISLLHARTRLGAADLLAVVRKTVTDAVPLVAAAACVGIVLGMVTLTGIGTRLPALLLPLAQQNIVFALVAIMISSIVLGMGLPSAVCYLLMATLIGPVIGRLGIVPLAAHLFIFYFGMMSMVTPPVALAAYTAGSIAGTNIVRTSLSAFRFALVGFTLPYMFVFRPALLLLAPEAAGHASAGPPGAGPVVAAVGLAVAGIVPFAAGIAGFLIAPLRPMERAGCFLASALLLFPGPTWSAGRVDVPLLALGGGLLLAAIIALNVSRRPKPDPGPTAGEVRTR